MSDAKIMYSSSAEDLIFTPQEAAQASKEYHQLLDDMEKETGMRGVPTGIPTLDRYLTPMILGETRLIVSRPGNVKTGMLLRHCRWMADRIQRAGRGGTECAAYFTAETTVEALNDFMGASAIGVSIEAIIRGELTDEMRRKMDLWLDTERPLIPLFIIGQSVKRAKNRVPLSASTIREAFWIITEKYQKKIRLAAVDYIQALHAPAGVSPDKKNIVVEENLGIIHDVGIATRTVMEVGVQSGREADTYDPPFPDQNCMQWSSALEQGADSIVAQARLAKTIPTQKKEFWKMAFEKGGITTEPIGNLQEWREKVQCALFHKILKQRFGSVGDVVLTSYDPRYNKLDAWEKEQL